MIDRLFKKNIDRITDPRNLRSFWPAVYSGAAAMRFEAQAEMWLHSEQKNAQEVTWHKPERPAENKG